MMRRGFSLIELMVAIGLASFIMLGMMQGYRNAIRLQRNAQNLLVLNRRIALLFNQIERDITTATAYSKPVEYEKAEPKTGDKQAEQPTKEEPKQEKRTGKKDAKKEKPVPCIKMEVFDDATYKHRGKKWQTTKKMSLITTTPLEVFGDEQIRMVRAGYELKPDKKNSAAQRQVYTLLRKQTHQLKNVAFKQEEDAKVQNVSAYVVAENIKQFSLQATYMPKPPEDKNGDNKGAKAKKKDPVKTFVWEDKQAKESTTAFPEYLSLHIELWDGQYEKSYSFECMMPFFVRDPTSPLKGTTKGKFSDDKKDKASSSDGDKGKEPGSES